MHITRKVVDLGIWRTKKKCKGPLVFYNNYRLLKNRQQVLDIINHREITQSEIITSSHREYIYVTYLTGAKLKCLMTEARSHLSVHSNITAHSFYYMLVLQCYALVSGIKVDNGITQLYIPSI